MTLIYTTTAKVKDILEAGNEYNGRTNLTIPTEMGESLVTDIVNNAVAKSIPALPDSRLTQIATLLGAHFYQQFDKGHTRRRTGQREAYMQIKVGFALDSTLYGQSAKLLDTTGYLAELDKPGGIDLQLVWLGKRPSQQTPIERRW